MVEVGAETGDNFSLGMEDERRSLGNEGYTIHCAAICRHPPPPSSPSAGADGNCEGPMISSLSAVMRYAVLAGELWGHNYCNQITDNIIDVERANAVKSKVYYEWSRRFELQGRLAKGSALLRF